MTLNTQIHVPVAAMAVRTEPAKTSDAEMLGIAEPHALASGKDHPPMDLGATQSAVSGIAAAMMKFMHEFQSGPRAHMEEKKPMAAPSERPMTVAEIGVPRTPDSAPVAGSASGTIGQVQSTGAAIGTFGPRTPEPTAGPAGTAGGMIGQDTGTATLTTRSELRAAMKEGGLSETEMAGVESQLREKVIAQMESMQAAAVKMPPPHGTVTAGNSIAMMTGAASTQSDPASVSEPALHDSQTVSMAARQIATAFGTVPMPFAPGQPGLIKVEGPEDKMLHLSLGIISTDEP